MKKIMFLICSMCLIFALCSCGKEAEPTDMPLPDGYEQSQTEQTDDSQGLNETSSENGHLTFTVRKEESQDIETDKEMWMEFATDAEEVKAANGKSGSVKMGNENVYWISYPEGNGKYYQIDSMIFKDNYAYYITLADKASLEVEDGDYSNCKELTDEDFETLDSWLQKAVESI